LAASGEQAGNVRPQQSASSVKRQRQGQEEPQRQQPEPSGLDRALAALTRAWQGFRPSRLSSRQPTLPARPEASLESLRDLQWELRDREARYRDLLDHQGDVILRRDDQGRLIFVNDAFCRTFGLKREAALGQVFTLPLTEADQGEPEISPKTGARRSRIVELATAAGPRWFVWEDFVIASAAGGLSEIQSVGHDITEQRAAEIALAEIGRAHV
jgi:PAS domain S-box-containing protein